MKPLEKSLFPTLACFGPLLMVIGLRTGPSVTLHLLALLGAIMTSAALLILFRAVSRRPDQS